jgi:hypothetical protein
MLNEGEKISITLFKTSNFVERASQSEKGGSPTDKHTQSTE